MFLALNEARSALEAGDYPVGAALVVDGELWGTARNRLFTDNRTVAHAEHNLFDKLSGQLRQKRFDRRVDYPIFLYTTLEPCLMCLGTALMHYVSRIVIACPDPNGGAANLDPMPLGTVYQQRWPEIVFRAIPRGIPTVNYQILEIGEVSSLEGDVGTV